MIQIDPKRERRREPPGAKARDLNIESMKGRKTALRDRLPRASDRLILKYIDSESRGAWLCASGVQKRPEQRAAATAFFSFQKNTASNGISFPSDKPEF